MSDEIEFLDITYDIDYSSHPFPNEKWYVKGTQHIVEESLMIGPVVLFGLLGNSLIVYILIVNPHLRSPTNLLIGNMAAADLLTVLVHPWFILIYDLFQNYELGIYGCNGEGPLECCILISSVISMSAITYDRLIAIVLPNESRINKRAAIIIMISTWIIGLVMSIPLSLNRSYNERQWLDFLEKYCKENVVFVNIYWYVIVTVVVWLPLTIQLICYISIFIKLNKYEKKIKKSCRQHQVGYKRSAARMMFIITITFMICRLPFTGFIIYRHQLITQKNLSENAQNQVQGFYHGLWFTSKYLIFINAGLNPLVYGIANEKFRKAFQRTKWGKVLFPEKPPKPKGADKKQPKTVKWENKETEKTSKASKDNIFVVFSKTAFACTGNNQTYDTTVDIEKKQSKEKEKEIVVSYTSKNVE